MTLKERRKPAAPRRQPPAPHRRGQRHERSRGEPDAQGLRAGPHDDEGAQEGAAWPGRAAGADALSAGPVAVPAPGSGRGWPCRARFAGPGADCGDLHPGGFPGTMLRPCRLVGALPGVMRATSIAIPAEPTFSNRHGVRHARTSVSPHPEAVQHGGRHSHDAGRREEAALLPCRRRRFPAPARRSFRRDPRLLRPDGEALRVQDRRGRRSRLGSRQGAQPSIRRPRCCASAASSRREPSKPARPSRPSAPKKAVERAKPRKMTDAQGQEQGGAREEEGESQEAPAQEEVARHIRSPRSRRSLQEAAATLWPPGAPRGPAFAPGLAPRA